MTNDPLEMMRNLTSARAAAEAEQVAGRSRDRSRLLAATAHVDDITAATQTNNFGTKSGIMLTLSNLQNIRVAPGSDPIQPGTFGLFIPVPAKPNANSEAAQMATSAAAANNSVDSLLDLKGRIISFEERVHKFTGRSRTDELDDNGQNIWKDREFTVYYYHLTRVSGSGTEANNATIQPSPETRAAVVNYVMSAVAGGATEPFNIGAVAADLKSLGVDLQARENQEIQSALVAGKLQEWAGVKEVVTA